MRRVLSSAARYRLMILLSRHRRKTERLANGDAMFYKARAEGGFAPVSTDEIVLAAKQALSSRLRRGTSLSNPALVRDFLAVKLGALEYEVFVVVLLDTRHRLIEVIELFRGTIDSANVHPREVVKLALSRNAAAVILCHPHPSGVAEASRADEHITRRLIAALALVDIRVLDHLIIAGGEIVSLAERGLL